MKKAFWAVLLFLCAVTAAAAQPAADPRIENIPYDPDHIALLRGTLGYAFMLEFDPAEKIETVSIGDSLSWQVTPNRRANVLFLKPLARSSTNLTVLTDARTYSFALEVAPESSNAPILYIARMVYPPPPAAVSLPEAAPASAAAPLVANDNYAISGSPLNRPTRVFDDGHMTYFQWPADAALPAIFAISADGTESLVNYAVRGPYVVVDQLAPAFALRDGKNMVKVVDRGRKEASR
jgi:type IV secretion system protein VirB9